LTSFVRGIWVIAIIIITIWVVFGWFIKTSESRKRFKVVSLSTNKVAYAVIITIAISPSGFTRLICSAV